MTGQVFSPGGGKHPGPGAQGRNPGEKCRRAVGERACKWFFTTGSREAGEAGEGDIVGSRTALNATLRA